MADSKITQLAANTTPAVGDLLALVDDPAGSPSTQKITLQDMLKVLNALTADGTPDTAADYLLSYDASASTVKKVLMNLVGAAGVTSGPQSFGDNYVITPLVASNNLTVALKTIAGADPSSSDKITVRIGNTKREITAATSYTKNAATNWHNAGSAELAGKPIDFAVYAIQETGAAAGTKIGHSRIFHAKTMGDFVNTTTSEKYIAGSWTNFNATDEVEVIGRFRAQLSAGAGYNWSIASALVINRPIYETDWLTWQPVYDANYTTVTTTIARYKVRNRNCEITYRVNGTSGGSTTTHTLTLPFEVLGSANSPFIGGLLFSDAATGFGGAYAAGGTPDVLTALKYNAAAFTNAAGVALVGNGFYEIE